MVEMSEKTRETSSNLLLGLWRLWAKQAAGTPSWMTPAQLLPWRLLKCSFAFGGGVRQTQILSHFRTVFFGGDHFTSWCDKTICAQSRGSCPPGVLCASFAPNVLTLYLFPDGWPWAKLSARRVFPWIYTSSGRQAGGRACGHHCTIMTLKTLHGRMEGFLSDTCSCFPLPPC